MSKLDEASIEMAAQATLQVAGADDGFEYLDWDMIEKDKNVRNIVPVLITFPHSGKKVKVDVLKVNPLHEFTNEATTTKLLALRMARENDAEIEASDIQGGIDHYKALIINYILRPKFTEETIENVPADLQDLLVRAYNLVNKEAEEAEVVATFPETEPDTTG